MRKKIDFVEGVLVEFSILDMEGEKQRQLLNELALKEYSETGKLSSPKLQEANAQFLESATGHVLKDENNLDN